MQLILKNHVFFIIWLCFIYFIDSDISGSLCCVVLGVVLLLSLCSTGPVPVLCCYYFLPSAFSVSWLCCVITTICSCVFCSFCDGGFGALIGFLFHIVLSFSPFGEPDIFFHSQWMPYTCKSGLSDKMSRSHLAQQ